VTLIDHSKSLLENLYYFSGILIGFSLIIGLIQIILTKKTLKINSRRDAATLAAKQVEVYLTRVMPLIDTLTKVEKQNNTKTIKLEVGDFSRKDLIKKLGQSQYLEIAKSRLNIIYDILPVINSLESFSVYFIKEVADEEIAFSALGGTFVATVEFRYFDISYSIFDENDKSFQNTIALYNLWSARMAKTKLKKEYQILNEKIQKINDEKINPIGTK
jgi:hypothetical protein